ncbi:hypothetical protein LTR36_008944 [Oleoguttula mirabilis]|uniref:Uncharacterized protein n=1 Tax=Oleoguttula mirabilis TaxID=1507867 RepID=A0AAV9J7D6_9PEZI|nr:hypothetical protein LTR36_008944 [Oleoguttula mirabilis]
MCFEFLYRNLLPARPQIIIATGTRLGERSRRSSRELKPTLSPGRVQKAPHVPRKRSPKPWRRPSSAAGDHPPPRPKRVIWSELVLANGQSTSFTGKLVEMVRRHDRQRLLEHQRADIERHAASLQSQIDSFTLRHERLEERLSDDALRSERNLFTGCITALAKKQAKLEVQEVSVRNRLDGVVADQTTDEGGLFAAVEEFIRADSRDPGCIRLSDELRGRFRDARHTQRFLRTQEETLGRLKRELLSLQAVGSLVAPLLGRERTLRVRIRQLDRAMPARTSFVDRTMRTMYDVARATLLGQGLMRVQAAEPLGQPSAVTGYNDHPHTPPLDPADIERYQSFLDVVFTYRLDHDEFADTHAAKYAEFMANKPDATPTEWGRQWKTERGKEAAGLHTVEEVFLAVRDRVLAAGGEMLALNVDPSWDDLPEFAGRHPEDGTLGCVSEAFKQALAAAAEKNRPGIHKWLDLTTEEDDIETQSQAAAREDGSWLGDGSELMPWDSLSSLERRPRAIGRVEYQRTQAALMRQKLMEADV